MNVSPWLYVVIPPVLGLIALSPLLMKRRNTGRSDPLTRELMSPHSTRVMLLIAMTHTAMALGILVLPFLPFSRLLPEGDVRLSGFWQGLVTGLFISAASVWWMWLMFVVGRRMEPPHWPSARFSGYRHPRPEE